ncbi:hypothetical protein LJC58_08470 [Lachnospiraceae bacterium OttesenSCG-928-D06]|nr:hypothetical protein [Lachnospiraceae bacterium OttesenSCG-928-D06]
MKDIQNDFFKALADIQEVTVQIALCNKEKYKDTEDMLYEITYDTIYGVMELIDGYANENLKLDIVDRESKESIREGIELHDTCADYLKYSQ